MHMDMDLSVELGMGGNKPAGITSQYDWQICPDYILHWGACDFQISMKLAIVKGCRQFLELNLFTYDGSPSAILACSRNRRTRLIRLYQSLTSNQIETRPSPTRFSHLNVVVPIPNDRIRCSRSQIGRRPFFQHDLGSHSTYHRPPTRLSASILRATARVA